MQASIEQQQALPANGKIPMNQEEFDTRHHYISAEKRHCRLISRRRHTSRDRRQRFNALVITLRENGFSGVLYDKVKQTLPITDYLLRYDWRKNACGDLKEGLIEGMSHLPRALAFAQLAGINPFRGLFTAVFMPLFYALFEYDIHLSMGSSLIASHIIGSVTAKMITNSTSEINGQQLSHSETVAFTLFFFSSLLQVLLALFRPIIPLVDIAFSLMPRHLISGFCFGVVPIICFRQLPNIIHIEGDDPCSSFGSLSCIWLVDRWVRKVNPYVASVSFCLLIFLAISKFVVYIILRDKTILLIVADFTLVLLCAFLSKITSAEDAYNVKTIANSSSSVVPSLFIPDATIIPLIWDDIIVLAVLSTVIHWQLLSDLIKGKQRPTLNREVLTLGILGMSGSCLGSAPVLASEYWTKVSKQFSSSTAVSTLGSICFTAPFLFALAFLRSIPVCVLSCVIISSSIMMAFKCFDFRTLWRLSRIDAGLWMCAAICPLLFGRISMALLSAVACAIAVIALRLLRPRYSEQVSIGDNRGCYAEKDRYEDQNLDEASIAIVKFDAPILFINCERLIEQLRKTAANIKGSPMRDGATRGGITRSSAFTTLIDSPKQLTIVSRVDNTVGTKTDVNGELISVKTIILDCSAVSDADFSGITTLADACVDFAADNVRLFFASVNASLRDKLSDYKFYEKVHKNVLFPTVHDAVLSSQQSCAIVQIHMSASMNGCRDVITLSKAASRCDELDADEAVPSYTLQFEDARSSLSECSVSRSPRHLSVSVACDRM